MSLGLGQQFLRLKRTAMLPLRDLSYILQILLCRFLSSFKDTADLQRRLCNGAGLLQLQGPVLQLLLQLFILAAKPFQFLSLLHKDLQ